MFLVDTSVLSEAQRPKPALEVSLWLRRQRTIAIPFPAILEIEQGIVDVRRTKPDKADELRKWLSDVLASEFEYPETNPQVARTLAEMNCCGPLKNFWLVNPSSKKEKKPSQDLFIAAISIVHDLPVATMNDSDFLYINRFFPLPGVYNPSTGQWSVARASRHHHDFLTTEITILEAIFDQAMCEGEGEERGRANWRRPAEQPMFSPNRGHLEPAHPLPA